MKHQQQEQAPKNKMNKGAVQNGLKGKNGLNVKETEADLKNAGTKNTERQTNAAKDVNSSGQRGDQSREKGRDSGRSDDSSRSHS